MAEASGTVSGFDALYGSKRARDPKRRWAARLAIVNALVLVSAIPVAVSKKPSASALGGFAGSYAGTAVKGTGAKVTFRVRSTIDATLPPPTRSTDELQATRPPLPREFQTD